MCKEYISDGAAKSPLYKALITYASQNPARFHMPGHKGVATLLSGVFGDALSFDVTELPETDNLFDDTGAILEAEKAAAREYKTRETLFSAGGSTLCIQAMLRLVSKDGGRVISARNIHRAAVNAMALLGIEPVWVWPRPFEGSALPGVISPADIEEAVLQSPDVTAVYITSPDYYGVLSDIEGISAVCHRHNLPLLVDNAHGAHLNLLEGRLHPISQGADMTCDSAHKTLPALTGGAFLHINSTRFSREDTKEAMVLFGSTSPSYLIMLSLDLARVWMESDGRAEFAKLREKVTSIRKICLAHGFFSPPDAVFDPVRLTIDTASRGISGDTAALLLRQQGISVEMSDKRHIVLLPTPFNSQNDFARLENALNSLPLGPPITFEVLPLEKPKRRVSMREALMSQNKTVDIDDAQGRIAAQARCPCPPGVPLSMPGELISREMAKSLKSYGVLKINVVK
jgi:arginine/lysine/ornithine decarboxylase